MQAVVVENHLVHAVVAGVVAVLVYGGAVYFKRVRGQAELFERESLLGIYRRGNAVLLEFGKVFVHELHDLLVLGIGHKKLGGLRVCVVDDVLIFRELFDAHVVPYGLLDRH